MVKFPNISENAARYTRVSDWRSLSLVVVVASRPGPVGTMIVLYGRLTKDMSPSP